MKLSRDSIDAAVTAFAHKLILPQYVTYLDCPSALDQLLWDTLREYGVADQCWSKAMAQEKPA